MRKACKEFYSVKNLDERMEAILVKPCLGRSDLRWES